MLVLGIMEKVKNENIIGMTNVTVSFLGLIILLYLDALSFPLEFELRCQLSPVKSHSVKHV